MLIFLTNIWQNGTISVDKKVVIIMELSNAEVIYSSDKCKIICGEDSSGRLCALKNRAISPEVAERLTGIDSPYIARLIEYSEEYTVMKYADGTPLNELHTAPDRAYSIFCELCEALSALHSVGIIHRDIKPSNIILCSDGHINLIDFDAARVKKPTADKDTSFVGTDGFAPPEQFGFSQTDERSDIYALGVTMQLLLGEHYQRSRYRRVIEKCMRFNPEQRYSSVEQVKRALVFSRLGGTFIISAVAVCAAVCITVVALSSSDKPSVPVSSGGVESNSVITSEQSVSASAEADTSEISTEPIEYTVSPDSVRPFEWEGLLLPEGFPKLADAVTEFSASDTSVIFKWDMASIEETKAIVALLDKWAGGGVTESIETNMAWYWFDHKMYSMDVSRDSDEWVGVRAYQLSVHVSTKVPMADFQDKNCTATDYTVPSESSRTIAWEELALPDDFPKLADGVTAFTDKADSDDTYNFEIEWDYMSLSEMAVIADKLEEYYNSHFDITMDNGHAFCGAGTQDCNLSIDRIADDYARLYNDSQVSLNIWVY